MRSDKQKYTRMMGRVKRATELLESLGNLQGWRARIRLADGEMFTWHGACTREGLRYYRELLLQLSTADR